MKPISRVLEALARLYEQSQLGRTGVGELDFQPLYSELLKEARCEEGDAHELAERELRAHDGGLLALEFAHKRDRSAIFKVRLPRENESALYRLLGRPSPTETRQKWAELFAEAAGWLVHGPFGQSWRVFCQQCSCDCLRWKGMRDFKRADLDGGRDLLRIVARLLAQQQTDVFVRVVSCRITGDSKRLERQQGTIERLLATVTAGKVNSLADLGVLETPRQVLVAGPLCLCFSDHVTDIRQLRDGAALSIADIERAEVECRASRCVTVENKTSFHQRAITHPEELHIHTSYPGAAVLALLRKLPRDMEFLHFGDVDPTGFDILRDLRQSTGLSIRSLGMEGVAACDGPAINEEEIALLRKLIAHPSLAPERSVLEAMLVSKCKGAFEQEHRET